MKHKTADGLFTKPSVFGKPRPKFCIPILAQDTEEVITRMDSLAGSADIFEIRLDLMRDFDLERILGCSTTPILVTYRSMEQGGKGRARPSESAQYLLDAIKLGAAYVDVELTLPDRVRQKLLEQRGATKVIVSMHVIDHSPSWKKLWSTLVQAASVDPDIVKIVTYATRWTDNLRMLELIPRAHKFGINIIAFCMGPMGRTSRIVSHLLGGYMSFVSAGNGQETAPGQLTLEEMKKILRLCGYED